MAKRRTNGDDSRMALLKKGARLYQDFTGHIDEFEITKIKIDNFPDNLKNLVLIGECTGVLYDTVRDGKLEKYIHQFKRKNSRPLFCVTPDGNQIVLLGGAYKFTERGIVDDA